MKPEEERQIGEQIVDLFRGKTAAEMVKVLAGIIFAQCQVWQHEYDIMLLKTKEEQEQEQEQAKKNAEIEQSILAHVHQVPPQPAPQPPAPPAPVAAVQPPVAAVQIPTPPAGKFTPIPTCAVQTFDGKSKEGKKCPNPAGFGKDGLMCRQHAIFLEDIPE